MIRLTSVEPLEGHRVRVTLGDGGTRDVDVDRYIQTGSVFEAIRQHATAFTEVYIDPVDGTVSWPNGANIDTLVLLGEREPAPPLPLVGRGASS
jgi:hypothetical protein